MKTSYNKNLRTYKNKNEELCLNLFRIFTLVVMFFELIKFNIQNVLCCLAFILITFAPLILKKLMNIKFNFGPVFICVAYSFGAIVLGTVIGFYGKFEYWDVFIHTLSGGVFMLVFVLLSIAAFNKMNVTVPVWVHFVIAFALTAMVGMFWEIYEFSVDSFFGMNTQHRETGVVDTMQDILCNTSGAMAGIIIFYLSIAKSKIKSIGNMIFKFYKINNIKY